MAQHQLKQPEEALHALDDASQLITRLQAGQSKRDHDLLIAKILFREAEALINLKNQTVARETGNRI
jgi:hypothetical protein